MKRTARVLCNHEYHTLAFEPDGRIMSVGRKGGCGDVSAQAGRLAVSARLGRDPGVAGMNCAGLAALIQHGIPMFLRYAPNASGYIDLGPWDKLYHRFASTKLVAQRMEEVRRERDAPHDAALSMALDAIYKSKRHRRWTRDELKRYVNLLPDQPVHDGCLVAEVSTLFWNVPLQKNWHESVAKAGIASVDGLFVCGVNEKEPGIVYAVDEDGVRLVVKRYRLDGKHLRAA
jgi:hypothetical protein